MQFNSIQRRVEVGNSSLFLLLVFPYGICECLDFSQAYKKIMEIAFCPPSFLLVDRRLVSMETSTGTDISALILNLLYTRSLLVENVGKEAIELLYCFC